MLTCKNCYRRKNLARIGFHIDWLDCPYKCEYGDKMLDIFKRSGCKTIAEFEELQRGDNNG